MSTINIALIFNIRAWCTFMTATISNIQHRTTFQQFCLLFYELLHFNYLTCFFSATADLFESIIYIWIESIKRSFFVCCSSVAKFIDRNRIKIKRKNFAGCKVEKKKVESKRIGRRGREEKRWVRVAIKQTPCRVARGNPSQKTVIGNTFPPFFLKIIYECQAALIPRVTASTRRGIDRSCAKSLSSSDNNLSVSCCARGESEGA